MHQAGIFSNERVENVGQTAHGFYEKRKRKLNLGSINVRNISMCFLAFLMGRVSLIGGVSPFGMAFFAATYGRISPFAIGTSIVLGALSWAWSPEMAIKLIAETVLFGMLTMFEKWSKVQGRFVEGLKIFTSVFLVSLVPLIFKFLLYDFIMTILEASVTVMVFILLKRGASILFEDRKRSIYSAEEVISLGLIGALAIAGIRDFGILGTELRSIICIFIVLVFARAKGAGIGAAAGVVMGMVTSLTGDNNFNVIGSYAFSGLLAGMFKNLGNIGVILGFVTGNAVITYFVTGSTEVLIQLRDILAAAGAFYILPKKVVRRAGSIFEEGTSGLEEPDAGHLRSANAAVEKLNAFSKAVEELAATFKKVPEPEQVPGDVEVSTFFDTVAERVCKDCSLCLYCWDRKFSSTYQAMFTMLETLEQKGRLIPDDVPDCFSNDSCAKPREMVNTINSLYEVYRVNVLWKKKVAESRGLVCQQLRGVSEMIAQLAREIDTEISRKESLESKINMELEKNGFSIDDVTVEQNGEDKFEVTIQTKGCPGVRKCRDGMGAIVSGITGKRVAAGGFVCSPEKMKSKCRIRFTGTEAFGVTVGMARASKNGNDVSGDSYTFLELKDRKYVLGLSDGMGTGKNAARNSQIAIDLLEKFLESGFDRDIAVKIINSALVLKSAEESYATIDISAIDLYTGQVEFVKIGSPPAYIKKDEKVEIIKGASLPAGILENLDADLCDRKVNAGDFIIMVTDGVTDSNVDDEGYGDWIAEFLEDVDTKNPQELADMIKKRALKNCDEEIRDDITVLVAKVWERA